MFETILSVVSTVLLGALIIIMLKFKRDMPDIQHVLDDVGASIGEQMTEIFEKPSVSKAMSVLGKQSGEVRADKALRNKVANKILDQYPSIGFILEQLDLSPIEGVKLLNDPLVGPWIKGMISKATSGFLKKQPPQTDDQFGKFP